MRFIRTSNSFSYDLAFRFYCFWGLVGCIYLQMPLICIYYFIGIFYFGFIFNSKYIAGNTTHQLNMVSYMFGIYLAVFGLGYFLFVQALNFYSFLVFVVTQLAAICLMCWSIQLFYLFGAFSMFVLVAVLLFVIVGCVLGLWYVDLHLFVICGITGMFICGVVAGYCVGVVLWVLALILGGVLLQYV